MSQSVEAREALIHLYKCSECRGSLDIAEYALLLAVPGGSSAQFQRSFNLVAAVYKIFTREEPNPEIVPVFLQFLRYQLKPERMLKLTEITEKTMSRILSHKFVGKNYAGDRQCAVCFGEFEDAQLLHQVTLCRHKFHACCLDEWLQKKTTCPMCRQIIQKSWHFEWCLVNNQTNLLTL